jgi:hypothetical protein
MIFCIEPKEFPKPTLILETIELRDQNDFIWQIDRIKEGFFIRFMGDAYFAESFFSCELETGEHVLVNNTNCLYVYNSEFEAYEDVRNVITNLYTDDVWEAFTSFFTLRLNFFRELLESEEVY